uniref:FAM184 domain-containing protein n=2 Tax=Strongyloides stercoralis TaxID=6248 RepID=A0AAF5DSQ6_STRER
MYSEPENEDDYHLNVSLSHTSLRTISPLSHHGYDNNSTENHYKLRKSSKSPRSHKTAIVDPSPILPRLDSRPEIAAWPAPPQNNNLNILSTKKGSVIKTTSSSTKKPQILNKKIPQPVSPHSALSNTTTISSPGSIDKASMLNTSLSVKTEANNLCNESSQLYSILKVAACTGGNEKSFDSKLVKGRESELQRKIDSLEETLVEYERQKFSVIGSFSEYQERVAERERKLDAEYSRKIIALSEEVLSAKKDFEIRMKNFQALQEKFEREKECALEKLRKEHQKEIQLLEQRFSNSQLINLEQKYIIEIQRLEEERKCLKREKECLGNTFEIKLRRAQTLYETELTAAKMLYKRELEALRDHEEALKEELLARQEEYQDRIKEGEIKSKEIREKLNISGKKIDELISNIKKKDELIEELKFKVEQAKQMELSFINNCKERDQLGTLTKNHLQKLENEINENQKICTFLKNEKYELESKIKVQNEEIKNLKDKNNFLEIERNNLLSQSESQAEMQKSQLQAMEAVLESVTKEKEACKENYERELIKEKEASQEREFLMKKEFSLKLNKLEEQYSNLREKMVDCDDECLEKEQKMVTELETMMLENRKLREKIMNLEDQIDGKDCNKCDKFNRYECAVASMLRLTDDFNVGDDEERDNDNFNILFLRLETLVNKVEKLEKEIIKQPEKINTEKLDQEIQYDICQTEGEQKNENEKVIDEKDEKISKLEEKLLKNESEREHLSNDLTCALSEIENLKKQVKKIEGALQFEKSKKIQVSSSTGINIDSKQLNDILAGNIAELSHAKSESSIVKFVKVNSPEVDSENETITIMKTTIEEKDKEIQRLLELLKNSVQKNNVKEERKSSSSSDGSDTPSSLEKKISKDKKEKRTLQPGNEKFIDIRSKSPSANKNLKSSSNAGSIIDSQPLNDDKKKLYPNKTNLSRVKKDTITANNQDNKTEKRPAWKFSKSLNNPYLKEEYFKTISLENTKDKFKIGNIYDNLNKYNENIDNKSSTLFYQLNCKKDLPYEETTYITMPTNFVSQKYLHKENHAVEKRNSIQFTIYTV